MSEGKVKRDYSGKHVDMLSGCETIMGHAMSKIAELVTIRTDFTEIRFQEIISQIQNAYPEYLGVDSAAQLREATQNIKGIQKSTLKDLALFKVQVDVDYKKDKVNLNLILTRLGFSQFYGKAKLKDQEGLIQLLFQFKDNMSAELSAELTGNGMTESLITNISDRAEEIRGLNITQEMFKGLRKEITQAAQIEFNAIYGKVIKIARIAAKFYKKNKAVSELFSYSKTIKNLNKH